MALTKTPIELSSTPSIVDGGNATAITIDSSEQVGIGTALNLERTLTISTGLAKTSTSTSTPLAIQSNESSSNFRLSVHTVGGASAADRRAMFQTEEDGVANAGNIVLQPHGGSAVFGLNGNATFASGRGLQMADGTLIGFGTGNGTRPDFQIGGDNSGLKFICGTGSDDTDVIISTSGVMAVPNGIELGSGIDFTAANTLDDYEEGTVDWYTLTDGTATWTQSQANYRYGNYTKIGNKVHVSGNIYNGSLSGSQAAALRVPLPFTAANVGPGQNRVVGHAAVYNGSSAYTGDYTILKLEAGGSYGTVVSAGNGGAWGTVTFPAGGTIIIDITYTAA